MGLEHTLRNLDKLAFDQQNRVSRLEKDLADYRVQADGPFEHEERLNRYTHPNGKLSLAVIKKAAVKTPAFRQAGLTTAFFPQRNLLVFRIRARAWGPGC